MAKEADGEKRAPKPLQTRFTELLGLRYPIVQGGLAYLADARLAAATSNAGGLGQITAATLGSPERLREEIRKARQLTSYPFSVNFALGRTPVDDYVRVAAEENVPCVSVTGGNPQPLFELLDSLGYNGKRLVLVASVRTAQKAEVLGADAVMAVGFEGGGHLGRDDVGTMVLIPRIVDSVRVPVLASGGIGDGRGLAAALSLGADGIEMGTRFVATVECPASEAYKQALIDGTELDTTIIERAIGRPGRVLTGPVAQEILRLEAEHGDVDQLLPKLLPLISGETNKRAALSGDLRNGFVWAGQVTGLIHDLPTVEELIHRIVREARQTADRLRRCGL